MVRVRVQAVSMSESYLKYAEANRWSVRLAFAYEAGLAQAAPQRLDKQQMSDSAGKHPHPSPELHPTHSGSVWHT